MRKAIVVLLSSMLVLSLIQPANAAKSAFYLNLTKGCYSGTPTATRPLPWSSPTYKTLYPKSCFSPHHYEVFYISKLSSNLSNNDASQKEASDKCDLAATSYLSSTRYSDILSVAWFFPDAGAEEKKYGKKLICFFRFAYEESWDYSEVAYKPARQSA